MGEEQVQTNRFLIPETPIVPTAPLVRHGIVLGVGSLALFWATATSFYHFFRIGAQFNRNFIHNSVIAVHDFLGVSAVLMLTLLVLTWSMIFFFTDEIRELKVKSFGWLSAGAFLSILCGILGGQAMGGTFGAFVGGKLAAFFGVKVSLVLMVAAEGMALFLATERFFSLRRVGAAKDTVVPGPLSSGPEASLGLSAEESEQLSQAPLEIGGETKSTVLGSESPAETATMEATSPELASPTASSSETEVPVRRRRQRVRREEPVAEERFNLEAALDIQPDPQMDALVKGPKFPKRVPPGFMIGTADYPEGSAPVAAPAPLEMIAEPEIQKPELPVPQEERIAKLQEASERALKEYVIPPAPETVVASKVEELEKELIQESAPAPEMQSVAVAELASTVSTEIPAAVESPLTPAPSSIATPVIDSESGNFLDRAARLVIQEGRASVSLLQRRLNVPFSRASILLDLLEKEGVIGPYRGGPSRDILLSPADWEERSKAKANDTSTLPQA